MWWDIRGVAWTECVWSCGAEIFCLWRRPKWASPYTNPKGISGWILIFTSRTEPNSAINFNFLPRVLMGNQCIWPNPNLMLPNLQFPWKCILLGFYFSPPQWPTQPLRMNAIISRKSGHKIWTHLGVQVEMLEVAKPTTCAMINHCQEFQW